MLGALALGGLAAVVVFWWRAEDHVPAGGAGLALAIGRLAGLLAAYAVMAQLVLAARLPVLERRVGLDALLRWHRVNGVVVIALVGAHLVLVVGAYRLLLRSRSLPAALRELAASMPGVLLALIGGALLALLALASAKGVRRRLPYEAWYAVHLGAYAAVVLTLPHQLWSGSTFVDRPVARLVWLAAYAGAAGAFVGSRWVLPLARSARHRLRVAGVEPETQAGDVVSVRVSGRRLEQLRAMPGQFFVWRVLTRSEWWRPHPFSLSAAPSGGTLRVTVQAVGGGTRHLVGALQPGTALVAEGPYGVFTTAGCRGRGVLLLGAGVGITPLRAIAESVDDSAGILVVHRVSRPDQQLFRAEFAALAARRAMSTYVLAGPRRSPDSWWPAGRGLGADTSDAEALRALVPDLRARDVFVCGPPQWSGAVRRSLAEVGVPARQVHVERFGW